MIVRTSTWRDERNRTTIVRIEYEVDDRHGLLLTQFSHGDLIALTTQAVDFVIRPFLRSCQDYAIKVWADSARRDCQP